jgi:L-cysteine:1D-myo-inositol 2-amino-2-deoxy-alpha-D-glucopyranoside ligase
LGFGGASGGGPPHDLDAPGALAVVDTWADAVLGSDDGAGVTPAGAKLVSDAVDALLGVAL